MPWSSDQWLTWPSMRRVSDAISRETSSGERGSTRKDHSTGKPSASVFAIHGAWVSGTSMSPIRETVSTQTWLVSWRPPMLLVTCTVGARGSADHATDSNHSAMSSVSRKFCWASPGSGTGIFAPSESERAIIHSMSWPTAGRAEKPGRDITRLTVSSRSLIAAISRSAALAENFARVRTVASRRPRSTP